MLIPIVPIALAVPVTLIALALLILSFGKDIVTLEISLKVNRAMERQILTDAAAKAKCPACAPPKGCFSG